MKATSESQKFCASLDSLSPIRKFVSDLAYSVGLDKSKTYKLCLAVDEIATNIINYGYLKSGEENGVIDVKITKNDGALTVILEDTAPPFNPFGNITPGDNELSLPLEERPIGGLGIMLAKQNVDEFDYKYQNGKNHNIFRVNI